MAHRVGANARSPPGCEGQPYAVAKRFDHAGAYIFQNADGRIVFAIPTRRFTLIGTTDVDFRRRRQCRGVGRGNRPPRRAAASTRPPIAPSDVVWTHAACARSMTGRRLGARGDRDFVLEREASRHRWVIGGKITRSGIRRGSVEEARLGFPTWGALDARQRAPRRRLPRPAISSPISLSFRSSTTRRRPPHGDLRHHGARHPVRAAALSDLGAPATVSTSAKSCTSSATNGPHRRTIFYGGAPSSGCA